MAFSVEIKWNADGKIQYFWAVIFSVCSFFSIFVFLFPFVSQYECDIGLLKKSENEASKWFGP